MRFGADFSLRPGLPGLRQTWKSSHAQGSKIRVISNGKGHHADRRQLLQDKRLRTALASPQVADGLRSLSVTMLNEIEKAPAGRL